ncbi:hypothetical protein, partial [Pseudomonas sp. LS_2]|uniref:hypothetical protein n=1 Tax=Pseudomonas sp. LS_2 TaxID=3055789 RepID=UPI003656DFB6
MFKRPLIASLLALACTSSLALDSTQLSQTQLLRLASELASVAGPSQWQQLWQRVRKAGYFSPHPTQPHFTLPQAMLPGLARQTLEQADHAEALGATQALYRRDLSPTVLGQHQGRALSALCLVVDWRALPAP